MVKGNPGQIRNRLGILIAEKEHRDAHAWSYLAIQEATGIAPSTLTDWGTGRVKRYDAKTLAALCAFFGCQVGELLEYVASPPASSKRRAG